MTIEAEQIADDLARYKSGDMDSREVALFLEEAPSHIETLLALIKP